MEKKIGLLGALLIAAAYAPNAPARSTANLDDVLRTAVEQRRVPGAVAMVATADAVAYEGAFGIQKDANLGADKLHRSHHRQRHHRSPQRR